ncbi:hypothetical protein NKH77_39290 [Streptomyces sp. M19]
MVSLPSAGGRTAARCGATTRRFAGRCPGGSMIRVLLAEDMDLIRGSGRPAFAGAGHGRGGRGVLGEAVLPAVERHRPDVAVLDIQMPGSVDGLQAARGSWTGSHGARS